MIRLFHWQRRFGAVVVVTVLLTVAMTPLVGAQAPDAFARRIEVLDAAIAATVAADDLPSLSIGIVHDQDLLWAKSYGFANLEKRIPASPTTLYRIASITKVFTATAIMQLRDAGTLHLDDPVVKYLPWFAPKNPFPNSPAITLWDVMTHSSGLPVEPVEWAGVDFATRDEVIRILPQLELVSPPGVAYRYSNLGYLLLGEVVAAVSGQPYATFIESHILKPLGMNATRFAAEPGTPGVAVGYWRRAAHMPNEPRPAGNGMPNRPAGNLTAQAPGIAAGGLTTNVEDLARFASLQFRDSSVRDAQIVRGSTLREMQRVQFLRPDWQSGAGFGWNPIAKVGEQIRVEQNGGGPGFVAYLVLAPADKLAVVVLVNSIESSDIRRILNLAFETAASAAVAEPTRSNTVPDPDPTWEKYVGIYCQGQGRHIMIRDGRLVMINPLAASPWSSRLTLQPVALHTFRMLTGGSAYGPLLKFDLNSNGLVSGLWLGGDYCERQAR